MKVKHYFADHITSDHAIEFIDPVSFERLVVPIEHFLDQKKLSHPDLSTQPLLSIRSYVQLVTALHSLENLDKDPSFESLIQEIYHSYHQSIQSYVRRNGTWMFDSLIILFMNIMDINIMLLSHETSMPITHYPPIDTEYTIVMYHLDNHFESVGFYKDEAMTRVFTTKDLSFP